jgi:hypothetical protein
MQAFCMLRPVLRFTGRLLNNKTDLPAAKVERLQQGPILSCLAWNMLNLNVFLGRERHEHRKHLSAFREAGVGIASLQKPGR